MFSSPFFTRSLDLLRVSARQVFRQRRRYIGVLISIAIGTAGAIVILTMGRIVKENLNKDLSLIGGATILRLTFESPASRRTKIDRLQWFLPDSVTAVRGLAGVQALTETAVKQSPGLTLLGTSMYDFRLMGTDQYFWEVTGNVIQSGRGFTPADLESHASVCVLGARLADKIFGTVAVVGQHFRIDESVFTIVGIMNADTAGDLGNYVFVPLTTMKDRIDDLPEANSLILRAQSWDDVELVAAAVPPAVAAVQNTTLLQVKVPRAALQQVKRIVFWVESFIYSAVASTLVLGGYGIWSGMMTAVRSRIREIGLKKAMGANELDILFQFLTEALCLSCGAAVAGIALGLGGVAYAGRVMGAYPDQDSVILFCLLSFLFSLLLGVIAGYYPALRASRMEVVTAIRYE